MDDDKEKQHKTFMGYDVYSNLILKKHEVDAVIITSCVFENEIRDKLRKLKYPDEKVIFFFDIG